MHEIVLFLAGIVVGAMNSIAGGGLLIGFPIMLALGIPPLTANATGHLAVLPGSLSAAYGYRKYIRKVDRLYMWLMLPCFVGGAIGALILRNTSNARFGEIVPWLIFFAVVLFAVQPFLHFHLHRHMHGKLKGIGPLFIIAIALFPVAIYGGYFGAGFGFIMLAFLGFSKLHDIHQMNGLKNLAGACISIVSIAFLFSAHLINWKYGLIMAAGGVVGGYYGAVLTQKISTHAIRIIVIVIGVSTAAYLGYRVS